MTTKLRFHADFPQKLRKEVEELLVKYTKLTERLVDEMDVRYEYAEVDGDNLAAINVSRRYRSATMYIFPRFFTLDPGERETTLAHEVAHILTIPTRKEVFRVIENWVPMESKEYVAGVFEEVDELVTDDLSRFFVALMNPEENPLVDLIKEAF